MIPEARSYRDAIGQFATGVALVATATRDGVHATTINSVASVSLDPLLLLFCPHERSALLRYLATAKRFSANFLRAEQQAISSYFAGANKSGNEPPPAFRFVEDHGTPRLEGALATIFCEVQRILDGGDHRIVIGSVRDIKIGIPPHRPLLFFKGRYGELDFSTGAEAPDLAQVIDEPAQVYYDPAS